MIYLLYGTETELINFFINTIKEDFPITKYNYKETSIEDILEDASYLDLFSSKKIIVVENSLFLTSEETLETDELEKYINNPNSNTILILVTQKQLDTRKKIVKLLKQKAIIKSFDKLTGFDLETQIKNDFNGYKIDNQSIKKIISLIGEDYSLIKEELNKLKLFVEAKEITIEDVNKVVSKSLETDIFKLVDACLKNDKQKMFSLYKDLNIIGEEPIKIIIMLSSQFRLLYQVKILIEDGFKESEISEFLKVHPYRVKLAHQKVYNYNQKKLLNIIESLANLDQILKTTTTDNNKLLEMFFLEL